MEPTSTSSRPARALHHLGPTLAVLAVILLTFVVIPFIVATNYLLAVPLSAALTFIAIRMGRK